MKSYIVHDGTPLLLRTNNGETRSIPIHDRKDDVAIVRLAKKSVTKKYLPIANDTPKDGDRLIGYGSGSVKKDASLDRKIRVVELSADVTAGPTMPGRFLAIHSNEKGFCHGDSGGPVFTNQNGVLVLSGVVSGGLNRTGDFACGAMGTIVTDLSKYSDWIKTESSRLLGTDQQVSSR